MPRLRRLVVPPSSLRGLRPHRLLRLVSVPARPPPRGRRRASVVQSYEPGEDWFWDYASKQYTVGPALVPPDAHPLDQPVPGPMGRVPPDWQRHLH